MGAFGYPRIGPAESTILVDSDLEVIGVQLLPECVVVVAGDGDKGLNLPDTIGTKENLKGG